MIATDEHAESVAEFTRRPLLSITAGDLGSTPEVLEGALDAFLEKGKKWDAVVLLDEADVFLETRSSHDLARNSVVSSKQSSPSKVSLH